MKVIHPLSGIHISTAFGDDEPSDRLRFVRQVGRRRYYVDVKYPDQKEFYILDSDVPLMHEEEDGPQCAIVHKKHKRYPNFGEYIIEKDGREVFLNRGKPFYMGLVNGKMHQISVTLSSPPKIRSRAGAPSGRAAHGGSYRMGGIASD